MTIWIDGTYRRPEEATVSVFDHGLLYGDGIFEGIRIYSGRIFRLEDHLARLYRSARALMITLPHSVEELARICREVVATSGQTSGYIRLVVTRGVGDLGVNPLLCPKPSVIIIVGDINVYPPEHYARGIAIITSSLRRVPLSSFDVRIKSLNYLNNVLAKLEAVKAGCFEALLLNQEGRVAECSADNIFCVSGGVLRTPAESEGALAGITRGVILELAAKLGIPVEETRLGTYDLYTADEVFLTGTGAELMPVVTVDHRTIGDGTPGPIFQQLLTAFRNLTHTE